MPISSRFAPPLLELLGLDRNGAVHGARFHVEDGLFVELVSSQIATTPGGYLAAAFTGPTTVVAVAPRRIDWLDAAGERFRVVNKLDLAVPTAVACFALPSTRETLVVCSDGFVARVAARGRPTRT